MPVSRDVIRVFASSPADVKEERESLNEIISDLNNIWSSRFNIILELIKWETHVHPAFSTDPQTVINDQIKDDYDVFIGILWGRFGTPTPRALSGTHEEFSRALTRHKKTGRPEIMIYFKETPLPLSQIDIDQFKKVKEFRNEISKLGGLYAVFNDTPEFETSLRSHLTSIVNKFSSDTTIKKTSITISDMKPDTINDDDLGLLDYLDIYTIKMADMNDTIHSLFDATMRFSSLISKRAEELKESKKLNNEDINTRKIIKRAAADLTDYAETLKNKLPGLSASRTEAFQALSNGLALYSDFPRDTYAIELQNFQTQLLFLLEAANNASESQAGFRTKINDLPRLISDINKAKRTTVIQMDALLDELEKTKSTINNIIEAVSKILQTPKQH